MNDADALIDFVYPQHILSNPAECLKSLILVPTNKQINAYNNTILDRIEGEQRTYVSADLLKEAEDTDIRSPNAILDYVARHPPHGIPPHATMIKTNALFRLLRNFSIERGLVKNTRLLVVSIGNRLITVRHLQENPHHIIDPEDILIPRITFTATLSSGHTLLRQQFPLMPAYAATFNGCQGMTLNYASIDLTILVFSHGQLYTALLRIRSRNNGMIRLPPGETTTKNVTYKELLL
jgi:hypothetical protein